MEQAPFKAAAENIVDAIYSRFLLRDMVGKVVPGSILLLTIIGSYLEKDDVFKLLEKIGFFAALMLFSLAWVTAFSIQSFGEHLGLIRYFPKKGEENAGDDRFNRYYQKIILFNKNATPLERMERERLLVIRESCGNTYVALVFSFIIYVLSYAVSSRSSFDIYVLKEQFKFLTPVIVSILPAIVCLRYMHVKYVERHDVFLKTILALSVLEKPYRW